MPLFRKKPAVVEAVAVMTAIEDTRNNWPALPAWFRDGCEKGSIIVDAVEKRVILKSLDGTNRVGEMGDWIMRDYGGEIFAIKPDALEKSYERVAI